MKGNARKYGSISFEQLLKRRKGKVCVHVKEVCVYMCVSVFSVFDCVSVSVYSEYE